MADNTVTGALELVPTYDCIGIYASFSEDENQDNFAFLDYKPSGSVNWIQGMDMTPDRRDMVRYDIANPYKNQWRASILGLLPNTHSSRPPV